MNHNNEFNIKELNLYQILELENNASTEDIRKSYKRLSLKYHPDKQIKSKLSEKEKSLQFIKIRDAYEILSDSAKRKKYDKEILIKNFGYNNLTDVIHDLQNMLTTKEYIIFMNILDNKIKQSLLNNIKIDDLFIQLNQMNLMDIFYTVNNFKILDIEIKIDFTIEQLYNNIYQRVKYNRITKEIFEEIIYPIDLVQIYENEGETMNINEIKYSGNFIVKLNIINNLHNNINYQILGNDLYASITKNYIYNDVIKINFLDNKFYNFNIKEIDTVETDFGRLYLIPNLGLPYYNTSTDIIDIEQCEILRGNLYLLIL
jgi:DnaJ-class molecular chaperone